MAGEGEDPEVSPPVTPEEGSEPAAEPPSPAASENESDY